MNSIKQNAGKLLVNSLAVVGGMAIPIFMLHRSQEENLWLAASSVAAFLLALLSSQD